MNKDVERQLGKDPNYPEDENVVINKNLRAGSKNDIELEKERIAGRLLTARFDYVDKEQPVRVVADDKILTKVYVIYPPPVDLIDKDLEGIPEVLRIVWGKEVELVGLASDNSGLVFTYRFDWEKDV